MQACRYCAGMRTGRIRLSETGAPEVIYDRFSYDPLENESSKPRITDSDEKTE